MAVSSISSTSSLKDVQQTAVKSKTDKSADTESTTTSKYDRYIKGEDTEDTGIYSTKDSDGYRYRTRQEKKELKAKKSHAFSFGGVFNISAASILERLMGTNNNQQ